MVLFLIRKIPELKKIELSRKEENVGFFLGAKKKIREIWCLLREKILESNSWSAIVQKALSKTRILALKTEKRTQVMLSGLREKNRQKREDQDYWDRVGEFSSKMEKPLKRKKQKK